MPHRFLSIEEAAECLHLSAAEIERLVKRDEIPFEKRGRRTVFRKVDVEAWGSQHVLSADPRRLERYHEQASRPARDATARELLLPDLITSGQIDAALPARTKASALREMVVLARRTGWVCSPYGLIESLAAREEMASTALPGGVAFLHSASQEPEQFGRSFVALGRTVQPIHFGASDARPTNLFFLLCSRDARQHLVLLSRLCRLVQETTLLVQMRDAPDAAAMHECLLAAERDAMDVTSSEEASPLS